MVMLITLFIQALPESGLRAVMNRYINLILRSNVLFFVWFLHELVIKIFDCRRRNAEVALNPQTISNTFS